jgi:PIN domain nuclease of toxin-antitoxin system
MKCLLDTHYLIWIVTNARRLKKFPWLQRYTPWRVSPVSFLEIQLLAESGRLRFRPAELTAAIQADPRFLLDDVFVSILLYKALNLSWTRDPFDRMLAAHSLARQLPLCTTDSEVQANHALIVPELR